MKNIYFEKYVIKQQTVVFFVILLLSHPPSPHPSPRPQVRYKVRQSKAMPAPPPRRIPTRRISTRRSGYAFSHAKGYGDLVTSGRFLLRRPQKNRPALFAQTDSPLSQNQPQLYRTITEEPEEPQSP